MDCEGEFVTSINHAKKQYQLRLFVVNSKTDNLLSREAAARMGLVMRIGAVDLPFGELDDKPVDCPPVKIILKENSQPYSLHTARRIPIPLQEKVKAELKRMEANGIIEEVTEPTDWCSPIVPVLKKNGSVRICTDLKKLNAAVKRERYMLPTLEDILHKLSGSVIFSKLDATSGFWQIPLDPSTAKLTTFITPCGRYFYKRLPFGISSAPEIFQRTMEYILRDEKNVICYFDDIFVHSQSDEQHEKDLLSVTNTLKKANLKLNKEKCELRKKKIEFLGHIISKDGVSPDPAKISAVINMPAPTNVTELRRLLGMINFLGRYIHNLSNLLRPMTELLEKDKEWIWGPSQEKAFTQVKEALISSPTLAFYDPAKPTIVSADASSYGLGGLLLQKHSDGLKPVAYCSRTLTPSEKRYAQIEKECLAVVWSCEKFSRYLVGLPSVTIQTDHKPLVPLINYKDLQDTPIRCQRMLMRLMRFSVLAEYVPGKEMMAADALSRSPQTCDNTDTDGVIQMISDIEHHLDSVDMTWSMEATDKRLKEIADESKKDSVIQAALHYVQVGWPEYASEVDDSLRDLYAVRGELSEHLGLLTRGSRIVIPDRLRADTLSKIHEGHQGINKCRERANISVWWPLLNEQIKQRVSSCQHCQKKQSSQRREPLITTELPDRPFQKCAADLFELKGQPYLVLVDYFSRYIEIAHLKNITSGEVIGRLKNFFAHHGIPELLITDNGRQFISSDFSDFADRWNFEHVTTSPYHAQANGEAERAVQTAKKIMSQPEPLLALLTYRDTPIAATGKSPAELAYGRRLRTTLPTLPANLIPRGYDRSTVAIKDRTAKLSNKRAFDRRHGVRSLKELQPGDVVLQKLDNQKSWGDPAVVREQCAPRSYLVQTPKGNFRRNRRHLRLSSNFKPDSPRPIPIPVQHTSPTQFSLFPNKRQDSRQQISTCSGPTTSHEGFNITKPRSPSSSIQLSTHEPVSSGSDLSSSAEGSAGHHDDFASARVDHASHPEGTTRQPVEISSRPPSTTVTRSGRIINRPARYQDL